MSISAVGREVGENSEGLGFIRISRNTAWSVVPFSNASSSENKKERQWRPLST
jgi:hypothetical protein